MSAENVAAVVGGGPAGLAAATIIARAGLATTVLASGPAPHWIETTAVSVAALLADLGLPRAALASLARPCRWEETDQARFHLDRAVLDRLLLDLARRAGACVRDARATRLIRESGRVVGVQTDCGHILPCRAVVDASGSRAWLSRLLGLRLLPLSPPLIAWRGEAGGLPAGMSDGAARFQAFEDGWLFLATCRGRTTWTAMGRSRRLPSFVPPHIDHAAARSVGWRLARPVAGSGWLLAGEAAGRLDPAWGEGLITAILSGIAAGQVAIACLKDPAREAVYHAAYDGWFADRIHNAAEGLRRRYCENGINLIGDAMAVA